MDNILLFLGLMKRASALAIGADGAFEAAMLKKARVLALASDAAKNAASSMETASEDVEIFLLKLPYTKAQLGEALGQKECAAFAVTDTGFAAALCRKLGLSEQEADLRDRLAREKARKTKKTAAGAAKRRGKA